MQHISIEMHLDAKDSFLLGPPPHTCILNHNCIEQSNPKTASPVTTSWSVCLSLYGNGIDDGQQVFDNISTRVEKSTGARERSSKKISNHRNVF